MSDVARGALLSLRREIAGLPAKQRIDRILERKDAMKVVRALPVQDLFATLQEVGLEDGLELLELCSSKQVQAFLDLDGWRGDRVDPNAMSRWMQGLFAANADRAVGQLRGIDIELLTLLVKASCQVYDLSQEEQPEGDVGLHSVTPDQRYLIVYGGITDDERTQLVVKELLERLMGRDMLFVLRLCEAVRWDLPSSLEEEAFRWRNGRITDLGFLPKHEAAALFAWRDPDGPLEDAPGPPPTPDEDAPSADLSTSVVFPWDALQSGTLAFTQAAQALPELTRARVFHDVMVTANRVHCAEGGDLGDPGALRATVRGVLETVGVGLSYRAAGDPKKLGELLGTKAISALFAVGNSLALKLQRELQARIRARDSGLDDTGLLRLDSPLRETAAGLLHARPRLYFGLLDERRVDYRSPASLVELAALSRAISEIGFRGALLGPRGLGVTDSFLAARGVTDPADQPSHGQVLGAMLLASLLSQGDAAPAPLDDDTLRKAQRALGDGGAGAEAVERFARRCRGFAPLPGAPTADDVESRARAFASQVMAAVTGELDRVGAPEGRFLASVWTAHARPRAATHDPGRGNDNDNDGDGDENDDDDDESDA